MTSELAAIRIERYERRNQVSASVQFHSRPPLTPTRFLVPELDAFDYSVRAAQIQRARLTAGVDSVTKLQFFISAIAEVNNDALKDNRSYFDTNLKLTKCSFLAAD